MVWTSLQLTGYVSVAHEVTRSIQATHTFTYCIHAPTPFAVPTLQAACACFVLNQHTPSVDESLRVRCALHRPWQCLGPNNTLLAVVCLCVCVWTLSPVQVLQYDCPDDAETYIHRVGRTARSSNDGKALLVLLPSEVKMLPLLEEAKIPLKQITVNPKHAVAATAKLRAEVWQRRFARIFIGQVIARLLSRRSWFGTVWQ